MNSNDSITFYYYTAWDGYAWQGCDESTAKTLQGYMEATNTLPKTSAEKPPFGGAVPCKLDNTVGVAVYRYHTRVNGDLSGRDSIYIALAFVPLSTGCVDFAKLLAVDQLAKTEPGELSKKTEFVDRLGVRLEDDGKVPPDWQDKGLDEGYRILRGREGLTVLSRLFFSPHTQLGFLNAVFRSETGIDGVESVQTYKPYPEVEGVAAASEKCRAERRKNGGVLPKNAESAVELNAALDNLAKWAKKAGYAGLHDYHKMKSEWMSDDAARIEKVASHSKEVGRLMEKTAKFYNAKSREAIVGQMLSDEDLEDVEKCKKKAMEMASLPVLDCKEYKDAINLSLEATERCSLILGVHDGLSRSRQAQKDAEAKLKSLQSESERKSCEVVPSGNGSQTDVSTLAASSAIKSKKGGKCAKLAGLIFDCVIMAVLAAIALAVVVLLCKVFWFSPHAKKGGAQVREPKAIQTRSQDDKSGRAVLPPKQPKVAVDEEAASATNNVDEAGAASEAKDGKGVENERDQS